MVGLGVVVVLVFVAVLSTLEGSSGVECASWLAPTIKRILVLTSCIPPGWTSCCERGSVGCAVCSRECERGCVGRGGGCEGELVRVSIFLRGGDALAPFRMNFVWGLYFFLNKFWRHGRGGWGDCNWRGSKWTPPVISWYHIRYIDLFFECDLVRIFLLSFRKRVVENSVRERELGVNPIWVGRIIMGVFSMN